MTKVEIYTSIFCGYCFSAKRILTEKGIIFTETNLTNKPEKRTEMVTRSAGKTSVPQIFISNVHIGGFDELNYLNKSGKLNNLLNKK